MESKEAPPPSYTEATQYTVPPPAGYAPVAPPAPPPAMALPGYPGYPGVTTTTGAQPLPSAGLALSHQTSPLIAGQVPQPYQPYAPQAQSSYVGAQASYNANAQQVMVHPTQYGVGGTQQSMQPLVTQPYTANASSEKLKYHDRFIRANNRHKYPSLPYQVGQADPRPKAFLAIISICILLSFVYGCYKLTRTLVFQDDLYGYF